MERPPFFPGMEEELPPWESFICLPQRALMDRRIDQSDLLVLCTVIAQTKPYELECTPSDAVLSRLSGIARESISRHLKRLEDAGYIRRIRDIKVPETGRLIKLQFRTFRSGREDRGSGASAGPPPAPAPDPSGASAGPLRRQRRTPPAPAPDPPPLMFEKEEKEENVTSRALARTGDQDRLDDCQPDPPVDLSTLSPAARKMTERLLRTAASPNPEPPPNPRKAGGERPSPAPAPTVLHVETVDLIRRLGSPCGPEAIEAAAQRLADRLDDRASLSCYRQVCERVASGEIPAGTAVKAFRKARSGTAERPGAVFVWALGVMMK